MHVICIFIPWVIFFFKFWMFSWVAQVYSSTHYVRSLPSYQSCTQNPHWGYSYINLVHSLWFDLHLQLRCAYWCAYPNSTGVAVASCDFLSLDRSMVQKLNNTHKLCNALGVLGGLQSATVPVKFCRSALDVKTSCSVHLVINILFLSICNIAEVVGQCARALKSAWHPIPGVNQICQNLSWAWLVQKKS